MEVDSNFLKDYEVFTKPLEVPSIFHTWCGMITLASAAQRKVWLDMGHFQISPNMYIILNSPPGKCGKDTAMNVVRDMVGDIAVIKTKSDSITKEKIFQDMMDYSTTFDLGGGRHMMHSSLTLFATEMSLLIKRGDKDFVSALNALYNTAPHFKHSTKHQGESIIIRPYLNILGGTTPGWINENIQDDILEGGLSARCLIIHSDTPNPPNPFPDITPEGRQAQERMLARLERITQIGGGFVMSADCKTLYSEWYIKHHNEVPDNPKMGGYHYRKRIHVLKSSMLLSLAEKDELEITDKNMMQALALMKMTEPALEHSLRGVGRNELAHLSQSILAFIKEHKELTFDELSANTFNEVTGKELGEILEALGNMGKIKTVIKDQKRLILYTGD